jgi:hypothetical protein
MSTRLSRTCAIAVVGLAVTSSVIMTAAARTPGRRAASAPFSDTLHPNGPVETCPKHTMNLPGNALSGAVTEALAEVPKLFARSKLAGLRADAASARDSGNARVKCGASVEAHTVTVKLTFPAYAPSASLQQHTVLVARFARGYRVWYVLR